MYTKFKGHQIKLINKRYHPSHRGMQMGSNPISGNANAIPKNGHIIAGGWGMSM